MKRLPRARHVPTSDLRFRGKFFRAADPRIQKREGVSVERFRDSGRIYGVSITSLRATSSDTADNKTTLRRFRVNDIQFDSIPTRKGEIITRG